MLIDTHVLIWLLENELGKLGDHALETLDAQPITISMASLIEMEVKKRKGKLDMPKTEAIAATLQAQNIDVLGILTPHISAMPGLDVTPHADPFDLLLMGQAIAEGLPLLTCDARILETVQPGLRLVDGRR